MGFLVVYYSKGGKTRKIADVITQELGCKAVDTGREAPDISGVDLLVVGSGTYIGKPGKQLQEFLSGLKPISNGKAAFFLTSSGNDPRPVKFLRNALEAKGYKVVSTFSCRGQYLLSSRGHPTEEDLKNAKVFAADLKDKIQKEN